MPRAPHLPHSCNVPPPLPAALVPCAPPYLLQPRRVCQLRDVSPHIPRHLRVPHALWCLLTAGQQAQHHIRATRALRQGRHQARGEQALQGREGGACTRALRQGRHLARGEQAYGAERGGGMHKSGRMLVEIATQVCQVCADQVGQVCVGWGWEGGQRCCQPTCSIRLMTVPCVGSVMRRPSRAAAARRTSSSSLPALAWPCPVAAPPSPPPPCSRGVAPVLSTSSRRYRAPAWLEATTPVACWPAEHRDQEAVRRLPLWHAGLQSTGTRKW